jgi:Uma2 family endonuclease
VEECLRGEPAGEVRHEYIGGQLYAMVGASDAHNLIAGNLLSAPCTGTCAADSARSSSPT